MAYGIPYNHRWVEAEAKAEAERRAGESQLGYLYRFDDVKYAGDEDHPGSGTHQVELTAFVILKRTPCGVMATPMAGRGFMIKPRFINDSWTKRYALPTIAEAMESFRRRKERQAGIYEARARLARNALAMTEPDSVVSKLSIGAVPCPTPPPVSTRSPT